MTAIYSGRCLCGAIAFEGRGAPELTACHCTMCRRWHGGPSLAVRFADGMAITGGQDQVGWWRSSDWAERGFCRTCGSTLFYRIIETGELSGEAGGFDLPDGLHIAEHYFIDRKPDYYAFADDAPQLTGAQVFARYGMSAPE